MTYISMYMVFWRRQLISLWILQIFLHFILPWTSLCFFLPFTSPVTSTTSFSSFLPSLHLHSTIFFSIVLSTYSLNVLFPLIWLLQFLQVTEWRLKLSRQHLLNREAQWHLSFWVLVIWLSIVIFGFIHLPKFS